MIGGVPRFGHITDCMRDVLHWLPVQQRIHYRISSIVWHCVLGNAPSYLLELFILTSACSGRHSLRSASKGDFLVPRARTATRQKRAFRLWVPLFGMVFHLNFVLCRGTFSVPFINSSRLSSLAGPGLGAPLSSCLERTYKRTRDPQLLSELKSATNRYHNLLATAKKKFYSSLVHSRSSNPRLLWKTIN